MPGTGRVRFVPMGMVVAALAAFAQPNSEPNPYRTVENWFHLPEGRTMGSTSAVWVASSGHIWVADRCGVNSCADSNLRADAGVRSVRQAPEELRRGHVCLPARLLVDKNGNSGSPTGRARNGKGHQVFKFSPDGKVLMTLGKAGVAGDGPDTFNQPNAVAIAPNGDIFVADGHGAGSGNARIVKFTKDGKSIKQWGRHGSGPGEFEMPHALAFDSQGPPLRGRPRQQPHPDFRPGRQVPRRVEAVQPAQRNLHRQA